MSGHDLRSHSAGKPAAIRRLHREALGRPIAPQSPAALVQPHYSSVDPGYDDRTGLYASFQHPDGPLAAQGPASPASLRPRLIPTTPVRVSGPGAFFSRVMNRAQGLPVSPAPLAAGMSPVAFAQMAHGMPVTHRSWSFIPNASPSAIPTRISVAPQTQTRSRLADDDSAAQDAAVEGDSDVDAALESLREELSRASVDLDALRGAARAQAMEALLARLAGPCAVVVAAAGKTTHGDK